MYLFVCCLQCWADTNVTLAFKDAQVIPPFCKEGSNDKRERYDRDDTDDTQMIYYNTDDTNDTDDTDDTDDYWNGWKWLDVA